MKYLLILICIGSFTLVTGSVNAQSKYADKIIGWWISEKDNNYEVAFTKSEKLDYYNKALTASATFHITQDTLIIADKSDGPLLYYTIASLTKHHLTLVPLSRGTLLNFRKE